MTTARLTAEQADAALKPFGIRVTTWGTSRTKLLVFHGDRGWSETMLKSKVAELIELRHQYG
jgi:BRCT domain type II-containing protein